MSGPAVTDLGTERGAGEPALAEGDQLVRPPAPPTVVPKRPQASPWGWFAAIVAATLPVAISPIVASHTFTPKYAVVLVVAGGGLVPFLASLRRSREAWPSWAALAFLLVGLVSALTSSAPNIGIFGLYAWGTAWLMWLGCAGAFGIGLRLRSHDFELLFRGLVVGAVANGIDAIYQTVWMPTSATFGTYQGRQADGFLGNPVYLEAFLIGALLVVGLRAARSPLTRRWFATWPPLLLLISVALEFSNERVAVALLAALVIGVVFASRGRGLLVGACILVGYAIGYLTEGRSLGHRIAEGTSSVGYHQRLQLWKTALRAMPHHLLIGVGPGELESGTLPWISQALGRTTTGRVFADAHDIVVEVLVTTGVLGLVCLVYWVGTGLWRARNVFGLFALGVFAVELVEPLNIGVTPLAFLAIGAGMALSNAARAPLSDPVADPVPLAPLARLAAAVAVAGGLVLGATMLAGDNDYAHAPPHQYLLSSAQQMNRLLPYWPDSADSVQQLYSYLAAVNHRPPVVRHYLLLAQHWALVGVDRDPTDPAALVTLAQISATLGQLRYAETTFDRAVQSDPWNIAALDGLGNVEARRGNWSAAVDYFSRELEVVPPAGRSAILNELNAARRHTTVSKTVP